MDQGPFINGVQQPIDDWEAGSGEMLSIGERTDKRSPNSIVRIVSVVDTGKIRVYLEYLDSAGKINYALTKDFGDLDSAHRYADLILTPVDLAEKLLRRR